MQAAAETRSTLSLTANCAATFASARASDPRANRAAPPRRTEVCRRRAQFFTPVGWEQATDELIAAYKASRFPADGPVADLCCGIGGDLLVLARADR